MAARDERHTLHSAKAMVAPRRSTVGTRRTSSAGPQPARYVTPSEMLTPGARTALSATHTHAHAQANTRTHKQTRARTRKTSHAHTGRCVVGCARVEMCRWVCACGGGGGPGQPPAATMATLVGTSMAEARQPPCIEPKKLCSAWSASRRVGTLQWRRRIQWRRRSVGLQLTRVLRLTRVLTRQVTDDPDYNPEM